MKQNKLTHIALSIVTFGWWILIYISCKNYLKTQEKPQTIKKDFKYEDNSKLAKALKKSSNCIMNYTEFSVAGTFRFQNNIKKIKKQILNVRPEDKYEGYTNKEIIEYMEDIWEYPPLLIEEINFIREPDNQHDKNAIKVMINDLQVGYVPKINQKDINDLIDTKIKGYILGGKIKMIDFDIDPIKMTEKETIVIEEHELSIKIELNKYPS